MYQVSCTCSQFTGLCYTSPQRASLYCTSGEAAVLPRVFIQFNQLSPRIMLSGRRLISQSLQLAACSLSFSLLIVKVSPRENPLSLRAILSERLKKPRLPAVLRNPIPTLGPLADAVGNKSACETTLLTARCYWSPFRSARSRARHHPKSRPSSTRGWFGFNRKRFQLQRLSVPRWLL